MKTRKIPLRKCIGCNESKPKKELIRVVKNKEDQINVDLTGKADGRGAYICNDPECFKKVKKGRKLNRTFSMEVSNDVYDDLLKEIEDDK